jgi:hypothetical protein
MSVGAGLLFLGSLLALSLSFYFRYLNARKDAIHGPSILYKAGDSPFYKTSADGHDYVDEEMLNDAGAGVDWVHFRYVT